MVPVETWVSHTFELSEPTEDLAGLSFTLEKVPKVMIVIIFFILYHQNHYHVKDYDGDHDIILKGGHCFRSSRHSAGNGN